MLHRPVSRWPASFGRVAPHGALHCGALRQQVAVINPAGQRSGGMNPSVEVWSVGGRPTEVLHLPATGEPSLQILVVPGNPGQAGYYTPFMASLHRLLCGRAAVYAASHLGMDAQRLCRRGELFTLEEQIEHKKELLRGHFVGEGRPPAVVVGHSIGTYMCVHALHRLEQAAAAGSGVVKVLGLFPFLTISPSCPKQSRIRRLADWHAPLAAAAALLHILPLPARRWLLARLSPELEDHAAETAAHLLHPTSLQNALFLARCEFKALAAPADWRLLRALGPRFAAFCCPDDQWFPEWKWRQMLQEVPGVDARWEEEQCHAFCVSRAKSHDLATKLVDLLRASGVAVPH